MHTEWLVNVSSGKVDLSGCGLKDYAGQPLRLGTQGTSRGRARVLPEVFDHTLVQRYIERGLLSRGLPGSRPEPARVPRVHAAPEPTTAPAPVPEPEPAPAPPTIDEDTTPANPAPELEPEPAPPTADEDTAPATPEPAPESVSTESEPAPEKPKQRRRRRKMSNS